ncbi:MAG: hypothetical protein Q3971_05770 [Moraxella sp.]|nr:hypothetical protein [Moraxella sp.]
MNEFELAFHIDKIARLKHLGKCEELRTYVSKQPNDIKAQLNVWVSQVLSRLQNDDIKDKLPLANQHSIDGWQAFYGHDYHQALDLFNQAMNESNWQQATPDSSLGVAKVYTRTGHWQLAKAWCLYYLTLARRSLCHFDMAKGYGALAEIFLRANAPKEALGCFQMAYHLMPLQSGQKARQYNFMASALLRHGEFLRAEALLYSSHQEIERALLVEPELVEYQAGLLHSQMRFSFLAVLSGGAVSPFVDLDNINQASAVGLKTMPSGMLWVVHGIYSLSQNDLKKASDEFYQAMMIFEGRLLFEYLWASRLYQYCQKIQGTDYQVCDTTVKKAQAVFGIEQINPPQTPIVFDQTWQNVELHNQGFVQLLQDDLDKQALIDVWQQFFI